MEFKDLSSTPRAVSDLNKLLGKTKSKEVKDRGKVISGYLIKACKLSRKVLRNLKSVIEEPDLISDYVASVGRFTVISEKIINKLEGNLNVKKDIEKS